MAGTLGEIQLDSPAPPENAHVLLHRQQDVLNYVHGQLGVPQPYKPNESIIALPKDLTSLSDDQLGNYLNTLGQWVNYIDYQLSHADGERQSAEAYLTYIQARVRLAIKARTGEKKPTTQDKNDVMETNQQVIEAREKSMFWEATYRLTKSLRDGVQLAWDTISRRITQRGQEVDRFRREGHVAGMPSASRAFTRIGG